MSWLDEISNFLEDYSGVEYDKLPAVLVEAIKELDTKLTNIETQLNSGE